ncbi:MAG: DNA translocase FtsK [Solobacterium sp.]|nr:DNA translocase FtsK [Solobacterium sp.]
MMLCTYADIHDGTTGWNPFIDMVALYRQYFSADMDINASGGLAGAFLYSLCSMLFGRAGTLLIIAVFFIIAALLLVSLDVYKKAFAIVCDFFRTPGSEEPPEQQKLPLEEEEKEPFNLWNWIAEHRKPKEQPVKKKRKKPVQPQEEITAMPAEEEEEQPVVRTMYNIRADGPMEEIPVVQIPGKVISSKKSVFINIDDLYEGDRPQEAEEVYEPEPVYEEPEEIIYEEEDETVFRQDDEPEEADFEPEVTEEPEKPKPKPVPKPRKPKVYRMPNANALLDNPVKTSADDENEAAAREKGELLIRILRNFDIEAELLDTHIGPSVTQFEIRPDANVKVSKILGLSDNIKMALAAKDVRVEAPIPGRNAVGVEIPNVSKTPVLMKEIFRLIPAKEKDRKLLFVVGKDLMGQAVTCRLDRMPHLLIAGSTGSGKSVCMNSIITSLLLRTKPDEVKMLLIDPKKVEFTPYQDIPHLIGPVINDPNKASAALKIIVQMMDERYNIFSSTGVRNIEVYNEKVRAQGGRPNPDGSPAPKMLHYIVVIIDELADLMAVAGKEVESSIQRITQLARAAGIHLIVATQRPSVDVITGLIKANIPSRIAFAVSSGTDSRTILDHVGAERLLGYGDMLYMPIGQNAPIRVEGVLVSDEEVARIAEDVKKNGTPEYDDHFIMLEGVEGNEGVIGVNEDPMFKEVRDYVIEAQKASTSLLQRRFGIGYNRAARMIDALESAGVIGPAQGSKPREVFIKPEK